MERIQRIAAGILTADPAGGAAMIWDSVMRLLHDILAKTMEPSP